MKARWALILRDVCLDDIAEDDFHLAECVNPDGSVAYWILDPDGDSRTTVPGVPEHEQLGELPWNVARRLAALLEPGRCNAPTKAGTRCRKSARGRPFHRHGSEPPQ